MTIQCLEVSFPTKLIQQTGYKILLTQHITTKFKEQFVKVLNLTDFC